MLLEQCLLRTSGKHCNVCILIKGPFDLQKGGPTEAV
ncbi:hypothetical protein C7964_1234 [Loktanella sp. PT4BL]|nr:hypothetical protein C7964_1234 [Loktanella sp. PT4BL]